MSNGPAEKVLSTGRNEVLLVPDAVYDRLVRILIRSVLGEKYGKMEEVKQHRVTKRTAKAAGDSK